MSAYVPAVVLGAGPTGTTAANLLGQYGVRCLVIDRWPDVYPLPRAVHFDDEVFRVFASMGLAEEVAAISRPLRGMRLTDRTHRVLAEITRCHAEDGAERITATTDVGNQPMAAAFARAGYRNTESRLILAAPAG